MAVSGLGVNSNRESPLSVARGWLPWCLGLILVMTAGWTALVVWYEVSYGNNKSLLETAIAVGGKAGMAAPLIPLFAVLVVSVLDTLGGLTMVTARYLTDKWLTPLIEKRRAEALEQVRKEVIAELQDWNNRRLEAEKNGEPFDEPFPYS